MPPVMRNLLLALAVLRLGKLNRKESSAGLEPADFEILAKERRPEGPVPSGSLRRGLLAIGCVLGGLVGAWATLRSDPAPSRFERPAIEVEVDQVGQTQRALFAAVEIEPAGCSGRQPVTLALVGSNEYWADLRRGYPRLTRFEIVLPRAADKVSVDLVDPAYGELPLVGLRGTRSPRLSTRISREEGRTTINGTVTGWERHRDAVRVSFEADWTRRRTLGTCWLEVPRLGDVRPARALPVRVRNRLADALVKRLGVRPKLTDLVFPDLLGESISRGRVTVQPTLGTLDSQASVRPPDSDSDAVPAWTCRPHDRSSGPVALSDAHFGEAAPAEVARQGGVRSRSLSSLARSEVGQSCAAVAVLEGASASFARDLALLLIGAAVSIGLTVLLLERLDPRLTLLVIGTFVLALPLTVSAWTTGFSLTTGQYLAGAGIGLAAVIVLAVLVDLARRVFRTTTKA